MKKIVTLLSAALMLLAGTSAFAQLSVGAGYVNSVDYSKLGKDQSAKSSGGSGFYAGVSYTAPLAAGFSFTPGVYYEFLTAETVAGDSFLAVGGRETEHYINVPLQLNLGFDLAKGVRLFAFAGPTANVGLISKSVTSASVGGHGGSSSTDNYANNSNYGRFYVMLGGGAGIKVANFKIFGGYNYGMLDRNKANDVTVRRSEIVVGVSFCM